MKMPIFIGKTKRGAPVSISPDSVNPHISIVGISGMGKTTEQLLIELEIVRNGGSVIVLNHDGAHDPDKINEGLFFLMGEYYHPINVEEQGIPIPLWDSTGKSSEQDLDREIDRVYELIMLALSGESPMGAVQKQTLREILYAAYPYRFKSQTGDQLDCIRAVLNSYYDCSLSDRLSYLLNRVKVVPCREGIKSVLPGKINVLNASEFEGAIRDFILGLIWRNMVQNFSATSPEVYVVLDEYQDLNFKPNSPMQAMLRKGRKYRLGLILTTQTQATFSRAAKAVLENAGTHIIFRPTLKETAELAKMMGGSKRERDEWANILCQLKLGEFIAVGQLIKDERVVYEPQQLRNRFKNPEIDIVKSHNFTQVF